MTCFDTAIGIINPTNPNDSNSLRSAQKRIESKLKLIDFLAITCAWKSVTNKKLTKRKRKRRLLYEKKNNRIVTGVSDGGIVAGWMWQQSFRFKEAPDSSKSSKSSASELKGDSSEKYYMCVPISGVEYWYPVFQGMKEAANALGVRAFYMGEHRVGFFQHRQMYLIRSWHLIQLNHVTN